MAVFSHSDQLYTVLKVLLDRVRDHDEGATRALVSSRMAIRLRLTGPSAEVFINGRQYPVQISYGALKIRPDLEVELPADALHQILLKELTLRKALASGQLKVRGRIIKTTALEPIFHRGQEIYPEVLREALIK